MKQDPMLDFVKNRLEENEGISREALARLLAAADRATASRQPAARNEKPETRNRKQETRNKKLETRNQKLVPTLLAASLAVAACGWFFYADAANARRESNLANVIDLLRVADGESPADSASLPENLLAWQDAPTLIADGD